MSQGVDSVRIALFDRDDPECFFVLTETDDPDNWKLPGGKFEVNEDGAPEEPDEAAARELDEEVGIGPKEAGLAKAEELVNDDGVSRRFIYAGLVVRESIKPGEDIAHTDWVTLDTIPEGKNQGHIRSAVTAARAIVSTD